MSASARKTLAANLPVPQTDSEAAAFGRSIGEHRRAVARLETAMNDEIAAIKQRYEDAARPARLAEKDQLAGLAIYAEANRQRLTGGGKVKFFDLGAGLCAWRALPPSVKIARARLDSLCGQLRKLGLQRFIRVKEEPDREAMLREPAAAQNCPGITISSEGEVFGFEPAEMKLAEDAS